jgi:hypothetical protein
MNLKLHTVYKIKRKTQQNAETFLQGEKFIVIEENKTDKGTDYTLKPLEGEFEDNYTKNDKVFTQKKGHFNYAPFVFEELKKH